MRTALFLQALGALLIAIGCAMLWPWLGVLTLGILVLIGGVVMEMEKAHGSSTD